MKNLKNIFLISFFVFIAAFGCISFLGNKNTTPEKTYASFESYDFSKYLTFNSAADFSDSNITKIDNYNYSIISNNAISVSPNIFEYQFSFDFVNYNDPFANAINPNIFNIIYSDEITLDINGGEFQIDYNNKSYIFRYAINSGNLNIQPKNFLRSEFIVNSNDSKFGFLFDSTTNKLKYISYINYDFSQESTPLKFNLYHGGWKKYNFNLLKPIVKFANQETDIVSFISYGLDAGDNVDGYRQKWLHSERSYESLTIEFLLILKNKGLFSV